MTTIMAPCRRTTIILDEHGLSSGIPALVAGIHVFLSVVAQSKTLMAGTSPDKPGHDDGEFGPWDAYKSPGGTKVSCFSVGTLGGHSETF